MAHRKLAILRRHFSTILYVMSLWLCIATLVLWVQSYWRLDEISYCRRADARARVWGVSSIAGQVDFGIATQFDATHPAYGPEPGWSFERRDRAEGLTLKQLEDEISVTASGSLLGFGFVIADNRARLALYAISVPHWFIAALFAVFPGLRLRAAFKWRRRDRRGHCPRCGYDLCATPARCPECGFRGDAET